MCLQNCIGISRHQSQHACGYLKKIEFSGSEKAGSSSKIIAFLTIREQDHGQLYSKIFEVETV